MWWSYRCWHLRQPGAWGHAARSLLLWCCCLLLLWSSACCCWVLTPSNCHFPTASMMGNRTSDIQAATSTSHLQAANDSSQGGEVSLLDLIKNPRPKSPPNLLSRPITRPKVKKSPEVHVLTNVAFQPHANSSIRHMQSIGRAFLPIAWCLGFCWFLLTRQKRRLYSEDHHETAFEIFPMPIQRL